MFVNKNLWRKRMQKEKILYYNNFETDFFDSGKEYTLPENYKWIRKDLWSRFLSTVIYTAAFIFSNIYCRLFLHVKIKGAKKVRQVKNTGFFFFGNHTQPVGDVFNPALACFPKRIYTVVSPANFALPVIGKILPYLGALPISDTLHGMKEFYNAMECRIKQNHPIVIYPEAHVWEYYTDIRPFPETSFKFPVKLGVPTFCFTTTYQKRRFGRKPAITIYVDGPFVVDGKTPKEKAQKLRDSVFDTMKQRSTESSYAYIKYATIQSQGNLYKNT